MNVENVEHAFVIRLLKEAKDFIHLVIKRKLATSIAPPMNGNHAPLDSMMIPHHDQTATTTIVDAAANIKRHNLAIQQTAATVMANYSNNYQNGNGTTTNGVNGTATPTTTTTTTASQPNAISIMMNSSTSLSSMKPIKVSLYKREKKDSFGIVLGCRYYIKDILPNTPAANEPSLKKVSLVLIIKNPLLIYD